MATVTVNHDGTGTVQWSEAGEEEFVKWSEPGGDRFDSVAADAVIFLAGNNARQRDLKGKTFSVDAEDERRLTVSCKTLYYN